jgi:hypothetical protein
MASRRTLAAIGRAAAIANLREGIHTITDQRDGEGEPEYLLNEGQTWFLALIATPEDGAMAANEIKHEVVKVLMAWRRDKLLPRWEVPHLAGICDDFNRMEQGLPLRPLRKD